MVLTTSNIFVWLIGFCPGGRCTEIHLNHSSNAQLHHSHPEPWDAAGSYTASEKATAGKDQLICQDVRYQNREVNEPTATSKCCIAEWETPACLSNLLLFGCISEWQSNGFLNTISRSSPECLSSSGGDSWLSLQWQLMKDRKNIQSWFTSLLLSLVTRPAEALLVFETNHSVVLAFFKSPSSRLLSQPAYLLTSSPPHLQFLRSSFWWSQHKIKTFPPLFFFLFFPLNPCPLFPSSSPRFNRTSSCCGGVSPECPATPCWGWGTTCPRSRTGKWPWWPKWPRGRTRCGGEQTTRSVWEVAIGRKKNWDHKLQNYTEGRKSDCFLYPVGSKSCSQK